MSRGHPLEDLAMEDKKVLMLLKLELESRIAARTVMLNQTRVIMLNIASVCSKLVRDAEAGVEDQAQKASRGAVPERRGVSADDVVGP
jgi:hypothetical protein